MILPGPGCSHTYCWALGSLGGAVGRIGIAIAVAAACMRWSTRSEAQSVVTWCPVPGMRPAGAMYKCVTDCLLAGEWWLCYHDSRDTVLGWCMHVDCCSRSVLLMPMSPSTGHVCVASVHQTTSSTLPLYILITPLQILTSFNLINFILIQVYLNPKSI
jgi:hypothetical protein